MIIHFRTGRGTQAVVGLPYIDFGFPTLGQGGVAPVTTVALGNLGPTPGAAPQKYDDKREERWAEIARRRGEVERQIEALFDRPQPETPPPAAEPVVAREVAEVRAELPRLDTAIDRRRIGNAERLLATAEAHLATALREVARVALERAAVALAAHRAAEAAAQIEAERLAKIRRFEDDVAILMMSL